MANRAVAGYVLGELLGRGGMGAVYAAQQPALGRAVAIKLLHPELAAEPAIVDRFRTEAVAGSRLSHPNVAGVIDFGVTAEGTQFLVMERVMGERLGCILEREGALPVRRACKLVGQVLAALDAAHLAGIVHADVKSDNVLVDVGADGRDVATLIDFGIAYLVDRPPLDTDAGERVLSGTPDYIAPELVGGARPTTASDLYAAGVVLYELLTGQTPFRGGSAAEVLRRQVDDDVIAPSLRCPDAEISPALDRVVLRVLAKDPAMRYASAAELADALVAATPATSPARRNNERQGTIMRFSAATILLAACATTSTVSTPTGGPRGLRASEHLELANQEDHQARDRSTWPEQRMMTPGGYDRAGQPVVMPWFRSWDTSGEHEQLAAIHRSKADALQAAYEEACANRPAEEVTVSPLVRYGVGGWPTANGVIVYLSPNAGTPEQLLAAMRCHRAFMMLAPSDMGDCPLDLPGLELDARGDTAGITVSLTVKDSALIPELKRRAAHDLEVGQHQRSAAHE